MQGACVALLRERKRMNYDEITCRLSKPAPVTWMYKQLVNRDAGVDLVKRTLPELRRSMAVPNNAACRSKHPPSRLAEMLKTRHADRSRASDFSEPASDKGSPRGEQGPSPTIVAASEQHSDPTGEPCPKLLFDSALQHRISEQKSG